jgi:hypothetical protein
MNELLESLKRETESLWMISESDSRVDVVEENLPPILSLRDYWQKFYSELELEAIASTQLPDIYCQASVKRFKWLCSSQNGQYLKWRKIRDLLFDNLTNIRLYRVTLPVGHRFMYDEMILGQMRGNEENYVGITYGLVET